MEILGSTLHGFLLFSLASLSELCLFLSGLKDLFPLHMMDNKVGPGSTRAGQIRAKELNVFTDTQTCFKLTSHEFLKASEVSFNKKKRTKRAFLHFLLASLTESHSFWYSLKDLSLLHPGPAQAKTWTWIRTGSAQFGGKWVKYGITNQDKNKGRLESLQRIEALSRQATVLPAWAACDP